MTFTGPVVKDRVAFTQSLEYRYERTPVNSLPPLQRDTRNETFDSYTQIDANLSQKQSATVSFALFPQKLDYFGLNTFTPQPATPNLHERGYQAGLQHRYITNSGSLLSSQLSIRQFNADVLPNSSAPYQLCFRTRVCGADSRFEGQPSVPWPSYCNSRGCSHINCRPDPFEQQAMIEWFCKELECTFSHRSNSHSGISMSRDEDDRNIAFLFF
jgi:hypothetical protein